MTDRNSNGIDQREIAEEDPFAELTRIMGFDPRQPVRPAAAPVAVSEPVRAEAAKAMPVEPVVEPAQAPSPVAAASLNVEPAEADDFTIDLERELLGEFESYAGANDVGAPAEQVAQPSGEQVAQPSDRYSDAQSDPVPASRPATAGPELSVSADPADSELDMSALESELVFAGRDVPSDQLSSTMSAAEPVDVEDTTLEPVSAYSAPSIPVAASQDVTPTPEAAEEDFAAFDDAFALELQERPGTGSTMEDELVTSATAGTVETRNAESRYTEEEADPFALDVADFPEPEVKSASEVASPLPSFASMRGAIASHDDDRIADAADLDIEDLLALENAAMNSPPSGAAVPAAPQPAASAKAAPDLSLVEGLEAELNALLGNELTTPTPPRDMPVPAANAERVVSETVSWPRETAVASPSASTEPRSRATPILSAARNLSAGLDAWRSRSSADAPISPAPQPTLPVAAAAEDADLIDDFEVDLDDAAFDDAIFNSIAGEATEAERNYSQSETAVSKFKEREPTMSRDATDPYAALAALSADLKGTPSWPDSSTSDRSSFERSPVRTASAVHDAPEIETVDVPEHAVALADDLDLPEFAFEEPSTATFTDLDTEFANLLNDMKTHDPEPLAPASSYGDRRNDYAPLAGSYASVASAAATSASVPSYQARSTATYDDDIDARSQMRFDADAEYDQGARDALDEFDFDPDYEDDGVPPAYQQVAEPQSKRRGLLIAAVVGGVAILGGIGALAMSASGSNGGGEIALVKADPAPVKVKPENPGGTAIPNQNNKVYDSVAGADQAQAPQQDKLLSSAEEPVDIPLIDEGSDDLAATAAEAGQMPGLSQGEDDSEDGASTTGTTVPPSNAKSEDRIDQAMTDGAGVDSSVEVAAVAPRKVRTMIVKSDGTLVAREEPAPALPASSASKAIADPGVADVSSAPEAAAPSVDPVAKATTQKAAKSTIPANAPIAPSRPSDQPVDIVGEVKPQEVASLSPATAGGAWSMQIASQPSEAAAQSSYQDLLRRYGAVLNGHQANIVKAEITGKGTFWRVRVPAGSRSDAVQLCERYKGAGGNCFVSK